MARTPRDRRRRPVVAAVLSSFALVGALLAGAPSAAADFGRPAQPADPASKIDFDVTHSLERKNLLDYWVMFGADADTSTARASTDWVTRGQQVVDTLKSTAADSQAEAVKLLDTTGVAYDTHWVTNAILVKDGSRELATQLAGLTSVERIRASATYEAPEPIDAKASGMAPQAVEWGVADINADDVWNLGYHGEGIVVANIDSGVDYDHPALVGSYRGTNGDGTFDHDYNWFDATGTSDEPFDGDPGNSHGSHTMGTMVGDDGAGNQIGVAPGARWIAANGCHTCSDADLIASGEWILEPTDLAGENPDVSKRPHVVNNSWGSLLPSNDPFMEDIQLAWADAGIFGAWSNGNSGDSCSSSGSPGSRTVNYSVGAYDANNAIADFSGRGPGQDGEIKPSIAAPGVAVRSSQDGGAYGLLSGTSMASPHLAGAVALLWSAAPSLVGDVEGTRALLDDTAIDVADDQCGGTEDDNNVWGEGRLDALALIESAPTGATGTLAGTVSDAGGAPVAGATVTITGAIDREVATGEDGTYSSVLTVGSYDVSVAAFGYATSTATAEITADATTTLDVTLAAAVSYAVSGTVADAASGEPLAGATVTVDGTPLEPVTTDASGSYTLAAVPAGAYTVTADAGRCNDTLSQELTVDAAETLDFALPKRADAYGYFCTEEPAAYTEGDTLVELTGDEETATLELPFPFTFYGQSYDTVHLSTNGHVNFLVPVTEYRHTALPNPDEPNAAIYPFWDDLELEADSAVYTGAVDGGFVIEYRNAGFFGGEASERMDFAVTLHEDGEITFAYRNLDPANPDELGAGATVGIENADGSDAFQYSFDEPALSDSTQVRFALPPNGFVGGTVTDANDGLPIAGAKVTATAQDGTVAQEVTTGEDGTYSMQLFFGAYAIATAPAGYVAGSQDVVINEEGESNTVDFTLATAIAEVEPGSFAWTLTEGSTRSADLTITNSGSADLTWEIGEVGRVSGRQKAPDIYSLDEATQAGQKVDPNARNALGLYTEEQLADLSAGGMGTADTGDVLAQWPTTGIDGVAWGVGYNGDVWVSDAEGITNHQYTADGTAGAVYPADWGGTWPGDMATDESTGALCQVSVGGDNGIHCFDPATGEESYAITGTGWTTLSQRGLAYNAVEDVFYIGGWNDGIIYTVAGQSHATPGETLAECATEDASIAGLAYNPTADVIWMVNSSLTTLLYQLSPADCSTISTIEFPEQGEGPGAGLEMDATGALWAASQLSGTAYLIDSGVPNVTDVPWLSVEPATGTTAAGETSTATVTVDTTGLEPGVYEATIRVATNAGRVPVISVPVSLVVPAYQVGVNAGGDEYVDGGENVWSADQKYTAANGWGWVGQRTETSSTAKAIGGTTDDVLYQDRRSGIFSYRFDDVPAGTYVIDLGFAEYKRDMLPARRVFDVSVNGDYVLVAHDVAAEVRGLWADQHEITVEHAGGDLTLQFHDRASYQLPIVNALRVTDRPDL